MSRSFVVLASAVLITIAVSAQDNPSTPKARVFISDSHSWQMSGGFGGANGSFGGTSQGGARPQTAEIIKTFGERCPDVVVNNKAEKANYVVLLDHEGGKGIALRDNKVAVFNSDGDSILSHSTRSLGNAVKDACEVIAKDWPARANRTPASQKSEANPDKQQGPAPSVSSISVSSTPASADIEIDGSFVGNTPSTIETTPGDHVVVVKKSGYKPWERKLKVTGGTVNISAELEKSE